MFGPAPHLTLRCGMRLEEEQQQRRDTTWPLGLRSPLLWPLLAATGGTLGWGSSLPLLSGLPAFVGFLWLTLSSSKPWGLPTLRWAATLAVATLMGGFLRSSAERVLVEPERATWVPQCHCVTLSDSEEIWAGRWAANGLCLPHNAPHPIPVLLYTPSFIAAHTGLRGFAHWMPFEQRADFNERAWRRSSGLSSAVEFINSERWTAPKTRFALPPATGIREELSTFYSNEFSGPVAGFLLGISTGDKSLLPDNWKHAFQVAGLSHLLAVSGYHVGLVGFLSILLARSRRTLLRWLGLMLLPAIWGFIWVCGFPVSAVRSGVMVTAWTSAQSIRRPISGLQSWSLAGWSLLLFNPMALTSLGAQLSFLAVLSILIGVLALAPLLTSISSRLLRWGLGMIIVPLIAQIGTSPLTLPAFGIFPTAFLPMNLAASPLMTLTGLGIALLAALHIAGAPVSWLTAGMDRVLKFCGEFLVAWSDRSVAFFEWGHLNPWGLMLATGSILLALLVLVVPQGRPRTWMTRSLTATLCWLPWFFGETTLAPETGVHWLEASCPTGMVATEARAVQCFSFAQRDLNLCKSCAEQKGLKMQKALLMGRLSYRSGLVKVGDWVQTVHWQPDGSVEVEELGEGLVYIPLPFGNVRNRQNGIHPIVPP